MINKKDFCEYMRHVKKNYEAILKLEDALGTGVVIEGDLQSLVSYSAEHTYKILNENTYRILNIKNDWKYYDVYADCFWELICNGKYAYYIDDVEFIVDTFEKFYDYWYDVINSKDEEEND